MKSHRTMQASLLEKAAPFLEERPSFSPALEGSDALAYGFRVGGCFLTISEMEALIAAKPHFDASEEALLMAGRKRHRSWPGSATDIEDQVETLLENASRHTRQGES